MRRLLLATAAAVCLSTPALALQDFQQSRMDPRSGTFTYRHGEIYKIECTMLSTVTIILDPDEDAEAGGTLNGDPNAYQFESGGNMLVLKCMDETRAALKRVTILSAHTINRKTKERRNYPFAVTTRPISADASTGIALATFVYPAQEQQRRAEAQRERAEQERQERGGARLDVAHYYGRRNRVYVPQAERGSPGAALAKGLRVSDNGTTTTFEFGPGHSRAAIFFVDASGQEFTMAQAPRDGGAVVVSRVVASKKQDPDTKERWILRLGDAALCLWNFDEGQQIQGFQGGTADPGVILRPKRRPRPVAAEVPTS